MRIGDRVRLNHSPKVGTVTLIKPTGIAVSWDDGLSNLYYERELRIVSTANRVKDFVGTFQDADSGVTIVGVLINGKVYKGTSKTCPREIFDPKIGELLASSRALQRAADQAHAEASLLACEDLPR